MASSMGLAPSSFEFATLQEDYGLIPTNGVEFPRGGAVITLTPPGKVGIYLMTFDASLRLPLNDFQE